MTSKAPSTTPSTTPPRAPTSELLLVGAGHTHLYVATHAAALVAAGYHVRLLAPRYFHYSGVASATAAGDLPVTAGRIDVARLARAAGITFHEGTLADLDHDRRVAVTADGTELAYDVLSLNLGSTAAPRDMQVDPAVLRVKPLSSLADLGARLGATDDATVTVVGGGATGLELAAHLAVRRGVARVRLLEGGPRVGADLSRGARRGLDRLLARRGVEVRTGCAVTHLGADAASSSDGTTYPHDAAVLATGLAAPSLLADLDLGDADGVPVRATLQHVDHDEIYAVGDCAHFLPEPLPRIGVHGVRQGPVLHRSLLARRAGDALPTYDPQRRALAILDLGAGTGLAVWGPFWWQGAAALRLKRRIDRRWLATYQA